MKPIQLRVDGIPDVGEIYLQTDCYNGYLSSARVFIKDYFRIMTAGRTVCQRPM